jgi:hypothetical protein
MNAFDFDNLPDDLGFVPRLPGDLFEAAHAAFTEALSSGHVLATSARAAYVYDRGDNFGIEAIGQARNPGRASQGEDIVLELTIRVPAPQSRNGMGRLAELERAVVDAGLTAEQKRLEAELAEAEASATQAQERARQTREKLDTLRSKRQG